jgi:hypothetical protein
MEKNMQTNSFKAWDLNVFFKEYVDESGCTQWENTLSINPLLFIKDEISTRQVYTDIVIPCTFAETRYIISERPDQEYDWFEDMDYFLETAPPRIAQMLRALGKPEDYDESKGSTINISFNELVS